MFSNKLILIVLLIVIVVGTYSLEAPTDLKVERVSSPVISTLTPRFSWKVPDAANVRSRFQTAYQYKVSSSSANTGDIYQSEKVTSNETEVVFSKGSSLLKTDTTYYWSVKFFNSKGEESDYAPTVDFHVGLIQKAEWKAKWIGGFNMFRKEFSVSGSITSATVYMSGIGYSELYVNGKKQGDEVLSPAWTHYDERLIYATYDVTKVLTPNSKNTIGVMLGAGWFGMKDGENKPQALLLQLNVNGNTVLTSDETWKATTGPITSDSIYNGESYDARLEQDGWSQNGFNDSTWKTAKSAQGTNGVLSAQTTPNIRRLATFKPVKMTQPETGVYVFDFGQNFSGFCRLSVNGTAGQTVKLRHGELLNHYSGNPNMIYTDNLRSAKATDYYTLKGDPSGEVYEPRFTYHGFRFAEVTGYPGTPTLDSIVGVHIYSDVETIGSIQFSDATLNQIQHNILFGQQSNLMSVPTDCDQRDERLGWMGDAALSAEEAIFNFDMDAFYESWMQLIKDDQQNGEIPDVVPMIRYGSRPADPAWGAAYPGITYWLWKHRADLGVVEAQYDGVKGWIDWLSGSANKTGLKDIWSKYGDWVPPPKNPKANIHLTGAFFYILGVQQVSELANALGKTSDAQKYSKLAKDLGPQFNSAFFSNGKYGSNLQTSMVLPLYLDIVENKDQTFKDLLTDLSNHNNTLTTGILGTKYLPLVLAQNGRIDLAVTLGTNVVYPSWGYMFNNPIETEATTLWELWDSPSEGPSMNSRNHIMFGSVGHFFYRDLAGIQQTESSIGYKNSVIQPPDYNVLVGSVLSSTCGKTVTPYGEISSCWTRNGGLQCREAIKNQAINIDCGENGGLIKKIEYIGIDMRSTCGVSHDLYPESESICNLSGVRNVLEGNCLGKRSCEIENALDLLTECDKTGQKISVQASCSAADSFQLNTVIPPNTKSEVHINKLHLSNVVVTESGKTVWSGGKYVSGDEGVSSATDTGNGEIVFNVDSGTYKFSLTGSTTQLITQKVKEGESLSFECSEGGVISAIQEVRFRSCGSDFYTSKHVVEKECLFKSACTINADNETFQSTCPEEEDSYLIVKGYCSN